MNNWYYFYNSSGISKTNLKELSSKLEKLGYEFYQPKGLGAGPSLEQIVLWIHNNQFLSGVSIGILSNYLYDLLKMIYSWFRINKFRRNTIPIMEIFLHFRDIDNNRTRAVLKFRIDCSLNKKTLKKSLESQIKFLYSSSNKDIKCCYCSKTILGHCRFYLKRDNINKPICQNCFNTQFNN